MLEIQVLCISYKNKVALKAVGNKKGKGKRSVALQSAWMS